MPAASSSKKNPKTAEASDLVQASSGNVFADLQISNPEVALAKAELVQRIRGIIAERKLTQAQAAKVLGLDQPKISVLVRGRIDGYSIDRLLRCLAALGQQVEITVRPARERKNGSRQIVVNAGR